jgi:hypothetical protein
MKISIYFYLFILLILVYGLIGFFKGARFFGLARESTYFLNPLALISIGYYLASKYSLDFILNSFFISTFLLALFGIIETLFLPVSFFVNYYNTAKFYTEIIPIQDIYTVSDLSVFFGGALSKIEFASLGINHRLISFFGEPTTAGVYFGFVLLVLIIYSSSIKNVKFPLLFLFLISLISAILTQSRVALIIFFTGLFPLAPNLYVKLFSTKNLGRVFLILSFISIFIFSFNIEIFQIYLRHLLDSILLPEGGIEHKDPVRDFIFNLTNSEYFFGKGLNTEIVADLGYGLIYYRMGYVGLFVYLLFLIKILLITRRNPIWFLKKLGLSTLCFTFVVNFFNFYSGSFKSYNIIWTLIGYSYYVVSKNKKRDGDDRYRFNFNL